MKEGKEGGNEGSVSRWQEKVSEKVGWQGAEIDRCSV